MSAPCECGEPHPVAQRRVAQVDGTCVETRTFYCPPPALAGALPKARATTPVAEVALTGFTCLDPELEAAQAAAILEAEGACCAPVVDDRGALVGVVSASALSQGEAGSAPREVEDAMSPAPLTLQPAASVKEVAVAMARSGLQRVPLVTAAGEVVGVVTAMDLVRWLAGRGG